MNKGTSTCVNEASLEHTFERENKDLLVCDSGRPARTAKDSSANDDRLGVLALELLQFGLFLLVLFEERFEDLLELFCFTQPQLQSAARKERVRTVLRRTRRAW